MPQSVKHADAALQSEDYAADYPAAAAQRLGACTHVFYPLGSSSPSRLAAAHNCKSRLGLLCTVCFAPVTESSARIYRRQTLRFVPARVHSCNEVG